MATLFQVIALSSLDIAGEDTHDEPKLLYPDALKAAQDLKAQGKAFRVVSEPDSTEEERQAFRELGAIY